MTIEIVLGVICILFFAALLAVLVQEWRYYRLRRDVVMDRQKLFHSAAVFHVVTALKLTADQDLLDGVRRYVNGVERDGVQVVYAGKPAFGNARKSSQLPDVDWDAFVLTQYPTFDAWQTATASEDYRILRAEFTHTWSLGMKRSAVRNLMMPIVLLTKRVRHIISRGPAHYPLEPVEVPEEQRQQAELQKAFLDQVVRENRKYSEDALVIINFQKLGDADQSKSNAEYGNALVTALAERGHGPMHVGRAVTIEDDVDFDQVVIVSYPGIEYFAQLIRSKFFTRIVRGKQLGDDLSSPTVPILQHL